MADLFIEIVNMSISASYVVLAVLLLRLFYKNAPKWMMVALWGMVGFRLIFPFSFESVFSQIPSAETVSPNIMTSQIPTINSGIQVLNNAVNPVISESFRPMPGESANPLQVWCFIFAAIWILGMVVFAVYAAVSYGRIKHRVGTAVLLRDQIYQSENVNSPFVLGMIKPKIYLPFDMEEGNMPLVIAHEQTHIKRKDHLWKPLGFMLLGIHWFNPLIWVGYILLCRDIELACDEKVIKELDHDARADYSQTLLSCNVNRRMIEVCPLAFGEVGVKERIKAVLSYKKPTVWVVTGAVIVCLTVALCFLTNPKERYYGETDVNKLSFEQIELTEQYPEYFGLDATDGLDLYAIQHDYDGDFTYALFTSKEREPLSREFVSLMFDARFINAYYMRRILATYDVEKTDVRIIFYQPMDSSLWVEWQQHREGEDYDAKIRAYKEKIYTVLLGEEDVTHIEKQKSNAVLLYSDPTYNWVRDDIPKITLKDGKLYNETFGRAYYYTQFLETTMSESVFSQLRTKFGGRYRAIADDLEQNNAVIYRKGKASPIFRGVDVYYILVQNNGDIILVYGHYENGEKTGLIRWIYNVGK